MKKKHYDEQKKNGAVFRRVDSRLLEPSHEDELRGWLCIRGQIGTGTITRRGEKRLTLYRKAIALQAKGIIIRRGAKRLTL
jgi:hypothetical protein